MYRSREVGRLSRGCLCFYCQYKLFSNFHISHYLLMSIMSMQCVFQNNSNSKKQVVMHVCIQAGKMPIDRHGMVACSQGNQLTVNDTDDIPPGQLYIPYPVPGLWFITARAECFFESNGKDSANRLVNKYCIYQLVKFLKWYRRSPDLYPIRHIGRMGQDGPTGQNGPPTLSLIFLRVVISCTVIKILICSKCSLRIHVLQTCFIS